MTQQPYYPNGPQQPYPGQPAVQQNPQPQYPQQPQQPTYYQGYPGQQAPQQYAPQQPAQPPVQLANGGLDEFYGQPNTGGGPGVSWKGKPDGYTVQGTVPRDVGDGDVSQEVGAPNTAQAGQPQFFRDGRPKFVMAVPLQVAPSQEFPEGEARLFVRGQLKDELTRAMAEAGVTDNKIRAGAVVTVTLVQRKQGRGSIPMNVFAVNYTPPGGQAPQVQQQPAPQQYTPAPQAHYQQPTPPPPSQYQQGGPVTGAPSPAPVPAPAPQQVQQQAPAPAQQQAPQPPAGLTPEQQELLERLNAQQQAG